MDLPNPRPSFATIASWVDPKCISTTKDVFGKIDSLVVSKPTHLQKHVMIVKLEIILLQVSGQKINKKICEVATT